MSTIKNEFTLLTTYLKKEFGDLEIIPKEREERNSRSITINTATSFKVEEISEDYSHIDFQWKELSSYYDVDNDSFVDFLNLDFDKKKDTKKKYSTDNLEVIRFLIASDKNNVLFLITIYKFADKIVYIVGSPSFTGDIDRSIDNFLILHMGDFLVDKNMYAIKALLREKFKELYARPKEDRLPKLLSKLPFHVKCDASIDTIKKNLFVVNDDEHSNEICFSYNDQKYFYRFFERNIAFDGITKEHSIYLKPKAIRLHPKVNGFVLKLTLTYANMSIEHFLFITPDGEDIINKKFFESENDIKITFEFNNDRNMLNEDTIAFKFVEKTLFISKNYTTYDGFKFRISDELEIV